LFDFKLRYCAFLASLGLSIVITRLGRVICGL
jgi:hypothetical protein